MHMQSSTRKSRCAVMLTDMQIHVHCPSLNSPWGINLHFITVPLGCKCIKYSAYILKMQLSLEKICKTSPPRWIKTGTLSANYFSLDCLLNMNPKTFLSAVLECVVMAGRAWVWSRQPVNRDKGSIKKRLTGRVVLRTSTTRPGLESLLCGLQHAVDSTKTRPMHQDHETGRECTKKIIRVVLKCRRHPDLQFKHFK